MFGNTITQPNNLLHTANCPEINVIGLPIALLSQKWHVLYVLFMFTECELKFFNKRFLNIRKLAQLKNVAIDQELKISVTLIRRKQ